ncbi:MAG: efflux RND transporter periplasmic adaptor subunit [Bacteroidales bacterium]|jgi:membrane fusion protein (multidrug efflux system)|nr:efflux RND transporter periplasmic adaptor subunit [Bacteroidales bacterium]
MKKLTIAIVILGLLVVGCNRNKEVTEETTSVHVGITHAIAKIYQPSRTFSGLVKANHEANLGATLPGRVEKIYFAEGQVAQKGALIAELSGEMLAQAITEYDAIKKDFERVSRLKDKGSISQVEYDHLKAKLEVSEEKVNMIRKNTQVTAPFTGTIVEITVHEGENFSLIPGVDVKSLSVNSGILKLMQLNPIKVTVDISEKDLSMVHIGQKATVKADAYPDKTFEGKVSYIKPMLSAMSHTATIEIEISNPSLVLKPGMYATVVFDLPQTKGVMVPIAAIYRQSGTSNDYVFTVANNKAHMLPVRQLQSMNDFVFVDGISEGTVIISSGKSKLIEGTTVTVNQNNK